MDDDGYLHFDYRKGGGIRHNGDFVSAAFVQQVLAEHPEVNGIAGPSLRGPERGQSVSRPA